MTVLKYLAHPVIALAIQVVIFVVFGSWGAGAATATLCYFYRETTQAEYRWIEAYGAGVRQNMPWWGRFDLRVWKVKDWTDWLVPMALTSAVALVMA